MHADVGVDMGILQRVPPKPILRLPLGALDRFQGRSAHSLGRDWDRLF
ncbi:MAG: hypothetical protein M3065_01470 [Actinomycetota bacterium]|nr:hypothetical protein [Actinomycetota bacterium]